MSSLARSAVRTNGRALAFILAMSVFGFAAAEPPPSPRDGPGVVRGRAVYEAKGCYQCHGHVGQGSILSGPALAGLSWTPEQVRTYIRAPYGVMPPYRKEILTNADLMAVSMFVAALKPGRPAREIAFLRSRAVPGSEGYPVVSAGSGPVPGGKTLYDRHCAACHGLDRAGGMGPSLRQESGKRTLEKTMALILSPPPAMPKLSPDPLSVEQVRAIAFYVRTPA